MLKNLLYAILLGAGMAACLSDGNTTEKVPQTTQEQETAATAATENSPEAATFTIGSGRVGPIIIGMNVSDMRRQLPRQITLKDTLLQQEGQENKAYLLQTVGAGGGLLIEQQCEPACQVWRIRVQNPGYKTAAGLGIGDTFSKVQQQYTIDYLATSEAGLVAVAEQERLSFVLDTSGIPKERLASLTPADIPETTTIKQIFVF